MDKNNIKSFIRVEIDVPETGNKLKKRREEIGLEISEVATYLGVTKRAIYKYEEHMSLPSIDTWVNLARLYQTSIDDLIVLIKRP